jgi:AcrR family transcriptional regulator
MATGKTRGFLRREPTQARSRVLVDSILVAFDQLLRTLGDERQVTIDRIIDRAGVSLGSFYEYFLDKDSLVGALVERATRENFATLLAAYDEHPAADLPGALRFFAERLVDTYLAHPARTRLWLAGIGRLQLMRFVTGERDRFARELAVRAAPLTGRPEAELVDALVVGCDACMGILVSELYRARPHRRDEIVARLVEVGAALVGPTAASSRA